MRLLKLIAALFAGLFLLGCALIVVAGCSDAQADADVIVVPGNTVSAYGTPSPRLQARLDVALALHRARRAPLIFVSGGLGKEGFDEAVVMANYLMANGVPAAAIVKDSQGVDTRATARNAAAFMQAGACRRRSLRRNTSTCRAPGWPLNVPACALPAKATRVMPNCATCTRSRGKWSATSLIS